MPAAHEAKRALSRGTIELATPSDKAESLTRGTLGSSLLSGVSLSQLRKVTSMTVCVVCYDLKRELRDRENDRSLLLGKIKSLGSWARLSESSYGLSTALTVRSIYDALAPYLDGNDQLYVITLSQPYKGFGPPEINSWLLQNLGASA